MITRMKYVEYLISTPINYTCSNLADHLDDISHDVVTDYLSQERLTARHLWDLTKPFIEDKPEACLIIDDSVQNKQYSQSIELVKRQYSGAEGGLLRGIGVVNLLHTDGNGQFYPIVVSIFCPKLELVGQRIGVCSFCDRELLTPTIVVVVGRWYRFESDRQWH